MPPRIDPDLEAFISENFDSEESLLLVLALRSDRDRRWSTSDLLRSLNETYYAGIQRDDVLLALKRFELRLRELEQKGLAETLREPELSFRYGVSGRRDTQVGAVGALFAADRYAVNRVIYGVTSRARVLADSFRL